MVKKWLLRSGFAALVVGGFMLVGNAVADPPKDDPFSSTGVCGGIENALEHANSPNAIEHLCGLAADKGCRSKPIIIHCMRKPPPKEDPAPGK